MSFDLFCDARQFLEMQLPHIWHQHVYADRALVLLDDSCCIRSRIRQHCLANRPVDNVPLLHHNCETAEGMDG